MVKVTDSYLACYEFDPSTTEDPPCKGAMLKRHPRHSTMVENYEFYYRKGKNTVQAGKKLTNVYREDVLKVRQCQNWFAKFRSGNFDVEDAPRSGRLVEVDKDDNGIS
ncbi:histone-lysine N-methyltransferase SETMAR [Trichonephila clavipes]|nr:histone-lysine N-methyltransferase SETMAR [Trichonephila clavipes]